MQRLVVFICFAFAMSFSASAQIPEAKMFKKKEDSLQMLSRKIIDASLPKDRFKADSLFTKVFVRTLLLPNSIDYPFDSVSISKLEAPDKSFRIYTWQLRIDDNIVRQRGAIQMRTADGKLKLFPLIDKSDVINSASDTITSNLAWFGAIYYRVILKQQEGKNYYTLIGLDENNRNSNKKVIDVLSFEDGKPVFGAPIFSIPSENVFRGQGSPARYIIEYNKEAVAKVQYEPAENMILIEHLVSETNQPAKKYTYVPDGDFDGLLWSGNSWVFKEKVIKNAIISSQAPMPNPIRDEKGNIDPSKLKDNQPQ